MQMQFRSLKTKASNSANEQYVILYSNSNNKNGIQRRNLRFFTISSLHREGPGIAQLVVLGLAVHSVAGSILLWGHFPVEGIFPLELTWVQTPFPQKLFRMRV